MPKIFNIYGACYPRYHYMVYLESRLAEVREMVDSGLYFTINRARQYGKTTLIAALEAYLRKDYQVISLDFQGIKSAEYADGASFVHAISREIVRKVRTLENVPDGIADDLHALADPNNVSVRMADLMSCFSQWCEASGNPPGSRH